MGPVSDERLARLRRLALTPAPGEAGFRYRDLEEIGRGGMGTVFSAEDTALARRVALKVLSAPGSQALADRMRLEARVLARLEHPGIVPIHDAGALPDGRVFYAMKLVRGQRLDVYCAAQSEAYAGLTARLRVFERICEPVAFAHSNGVIHRDLKPENIMVGEFGEVLVLDWGVAKILAEAEGGADLAASAPARTAHGMAIGTPGYMPPEQSCGASAVVDARSDVYSLGKILEWMSAVPRRARRPKRLHAIIAKAAAENPGQRYASARALAADVRRYLDGQPVSAYRDNPAERAWGVLNRHKTIAGLVLAYIAMRALLIFFLGR